MPYTSPVLELLDQPCQTLLPHCGYISILYCTVPWLRSTYPSSINLSQRPNAVTSQSPISINYELPFYGALDSGSVARLVLVVSIPSCPSTRMQGSSNPRVLSNRLQLHNQVLNNSTFVEHFYHSLIVASFIQCRRVPSESPFLFLRSFLQLYRLSKLLRLLNLAYVEVRLTCDCRCFCLCHTS